MKKSILVLSLVAFFVTALVAENKPVEKAKVKTETKACCAEADKKACGDKVEGKACGDKVEGKACCKAGEKTTEAKCCSGEKKATASTSKPAAKK